MVSSHLLAGLAQRLNQEAGAPSLPSLFFLTDPERTPDPCAVARRLPRGTAVIYRHFGAAERRVVARQLVSLCRSRGLKLLIAADPDLAQAVQADGVHWPEKRLPAARDAFPLVTASAHSTEAVTRAAASGIDACLLSPVFPTLSVSGHATLGLFRASQIARAAALPVIALGGVDEAHARRLSGRGFAGIAAVDALL